MAKENIEKSHSPFRKFHRFLHILGPGLITGAADDDPSGIATYSQSGAQFGLGQLWTVWLTYPLMTAVQETCARIGAVTGQGIAAVVKNNYSKKVLYPIVGLVLVANIINIGADIGAMAAALQLIFPIPFAAIALGFTISMLLLVIFTSYKTYAGILKWLALTMLAYPLTAFIIGIPLKQVVISSIIPQIEWNYDYFFLIVGVLGTTISPYMFFWQASEEVEEEKEKRRIINGKPHITPHFIRMLRLDNALGMLVSQIVTWFIIVVGATVLHTHGVTTVNSAADAAKALEPLVKNFPDAGFISKTIFAAGIIGLGLLAVPVLAGSLAYALSEVFEWKEGLNRKLKTSKGFYGAIILSTIIGMGMNFIGIDPIQALIYSAVFNGIAAVPLLFLILKIGGNKKIMGDYTSGILSKTLVWLTFIIMLLAVLGLLVSFVIKR